MNCCFFAIETRVMATPTAPLEGGPTVASLLAAASAQVDAIDAQALLLTALGRAAHDRAWLFAHGEDPLTPEAVAHYRSLVERRRHGEPLAYILGEREFFGLRLQVDARVLDPRADTETLVDWALECLATGAESSPRVLDLGTGSGAIALAIAHTAPSTSVTAVDASREALALAQANALRLGLKLRFAHGSWFDPVAGEQFDLVVSNPPYIAEDDPHLAALRHEPRVALVSGADGLDDLRRIIATAPAHLAPGGWLLLEHGWNQAEAVRALLTEAGFESVQSRHDLAGIARCSGGRWRTSSAKLRQFGFSLPPQEAKDHE
jgi:release factor glutamine methyltransferase